MTYALTFVLNLWRLRKITFTEQFIMAYGGLRGAIAFSLSMIIDLELYTFKGYELEAVRATPLLVLAHHSDSAVWICNVLYFVYLLGLVRSMEQFRK